MITLIISKSSGIFAIQIKYHKGNKLGKHPSFLARSGEFSFPVSKKNNLFFYLDGINTSVSNEYLFYGLEIFTFPLIFLFIYILDLINRHNEGF